MSIGWDSWRCHQFSSKERKKRRRINGTHMSWIVETDPIWTLTWYLTHPERCQTICSFFVFVSYIFPCTYICVSPISIYLQIYNCIHTGIYLSYFSLYLSIKSFPRSPWPAMCGLLAEVSGQEDWEGQLDGLLGLPLPNKKNGKDRLPVVSIFQGRAW